MTIEVVLSAGYVALIDEVDAERVLAFKWSFLENRRGHVIGYGCRNTRSLQADGTWKQHKVLLHRFVIDAPDGVEVDHENGDGLDCRRDNLRIATRAQNVANTGRRKGSSSTFKGVYYRVERNRWRSEITIDGKRYDLGTYGNEIDAAIAYDAAAFAAWGRFAFLNFHDGIVGHAPSIALASD